MKVIIPQALKVTKHVSYKGMYLQGPAITL